MLLHAGESDLELELKNNKKFSNMDAIEIKYLFPKYERITKDCMDPKCHAGKEMDLFCIEQILKRIRELKMNEKNNAQINIYEDAILAGEKILQSDEFLKAVTNEWYFFGVG